MLLGDSGGQAVTGGFFAGADIVEYLVLIQGGAKNSTTYSLGTPIGCVTSPRSARMKELRWADVRRREALSQSKIVP